MRMFEVTYDDAHGKKRSIRIEVQNQYRLMKELYKRVGFKCWVYKVEEVA